MFADPNYFLFAGAPNCNSPCVAVNPGFAWNHGTVAPDVTTSWLALAGPGVEKGGTDEGVWSDHADIRPTILLLLGLKDDYVHAGRALIEELDGWAVPSSVRKHGDAFLELAQIYKQINAPLGELGLNSLRVSTHAIESNTAGDSTYTNLENQLLSLTAQRNVLAAQIIGLLEGAEFNGQPINVHQAHSLIAQAQALLDQANWLIRLGPL